LTKAHENAFLAFGRAPRKAKGADPNRAQQRGRLTRRNHSVTPSDIESELLAEIVPDSRAISAGVRTRSATPTPAKELKAWFSATVNGVLAQQTDADRF
jgi:hypothetical protein